MRRQTLANRLGIDGHRSSVNEIAIEYGPVTGHNRKGTGLGRRCVTYPGMADHPKRLTELVRICNRLPSFVIGYWSFVTKS